MQSVTDFQELLVRNGVSVEQSDRYVRHLKRHAEMCRARADVFCIYGSDTAKAPWQREFKRLASNVTRMHPMVRIFNMTEDVTERRAACEALHDLIMEGV